MRKTRTIHNSTSYLVEQLTGAVALDHYSASSSAPLYRVDRLEWSDDSRRTSFRSTACRSSPGPPTSPAP